MPGENLVDILYRKRVSGAEIAHRAGRSGASAVPAFANRVALTAKQNVVAVVATWRQHGDRIRLRKSGQIVKVAVLAIAVFDVAAALAHRRALGRIATPSADHAHHLFAPLGELLAVSFAQCGARITATLGVNGVNRTVRRPHRWCRSGRQRAARTRAGPQRARTRRARCTRARFLGAIVSPRLPLG